MAPTLVVAPRHGSKHRRLTSLASLVVLASAAGCSGAPKYVIQDSVLASIAVDQKGPLLQAQQEMSVAREEEVKATADRRAALSEQDIVENEEKGAGLQVDSAKVALAAAELSGDLNKKAVAERDLKHADLGLQVAVSKAKWAKAKILMQTAALDAAEAHAGSAATKAELEKARLALAKNIKPSDDFNIANFESQNLDRQRRYEDALVKVDGRRNDVATALGKFTALKQQFDAEAPALSPVQPAVMAPYPVK